MKGLPNRSFPHYDDPSYVFGKDHTMGGWAETFDDVESNEPGRYEGFATDDAYDMKFQTMYNQGLDVLLDELMGTRTTRASFGRHVSSGSTYQKINFSSYLNQIYVSSNLR